MSLRAVDLNLLPVLRALLRERSVSRAAEALTLSQPATSAALKRLRQVFDDQLLLRVGGNMVLTPRGEALAVQVEASCANLESLFAKPAFDATSSKHRVVIAAPDQAAFLLAPLWLGRLADEAPGVRIRFVELGEQTIRDLIDRHVDFAIIPSFFIEDLPPAPLRYQPLFRDLSVALFRTGHALAEHNALKAEHLARWRMIGFHPSSTRIERKRRSELVGRAELDVLADVAQTTLPPFLLLDTDYYAITSQRMAERLSTMMPLVWRPLAFSTEPIEMGLAWSQLQDNDLAHSWFREMVTSTSRL